jgi:hypothetical protein
VKAHVVLVNIVERENGDQVGGIYRGETRYQCVAKAFQDIAGKPQGECLDEWKVLDVEILS